MTSHQVPTVLPWVHCTDWVSQDLFALDEKVSVVVVVVGKE